MNIGFITNLDKDNDLTYTNKLIKFVNENNSNALVSKSIANKINQDCIVVEEFNKIFEISDFIIVLGGDGTILKVAKECAYFKNKILGVNIGTLGYLADVEFKDAFDAIKKVLTNSYFIQKRMMLDSFIENNKIEKKVGIALNEVSIGTSIFSGMIKIKVEINGKFVDSYRTDGILIATPTGSTAYNLSAGGPIVNPEEELIVVNYVCPHALFARPYVISANDVMKISILSASKGAIMALDGSQTVHLNIGDNIYIKKSKYFTNIIKTNDLSFYDILRLKMVETRK